MIRIDPIIAVNQAYHHNNISGQSSHKYLKAGISPAIDMHYRWKEIYGGIQFIFDCNHYFIQKSTTDDTLNLFDSPPGQYFEFEPIVFIMLGINDY